MDKPTLKKLLGLLGKVVLVAVPAAISGYFSYQSSKAEAEAKANAGYITLVEAVKELKETVKAQEKDLARLEGKFEVVNAKATVPAPASIGMGSLGTIGHGSGAGSGAGLSAPKPPKKVVLGEELVVVGEVKKESELPADLNSAWKMQQMKK